jgi:hypothetical protein
MSKKTLLLIAGVAIMLTGATSAYAYHEGWDGWFNSGTLYYNSKTYTISGSCFCADDSTFSVTVDTFYVTAVPRIAFICAAGYGDSIFVYIDVTFTGWKYTGQSGTKAGAGSWSGSGYSNRLMTNKLFDFWGTWASTGNHFYYRPSPPTYTADWVVTGSNPLNAVTGGGTCSGSRTYYIP